MNCREAENLIFAARDGALDESQRATLAQHVAHCGACRALQTELEASARSWRAADAAAKVPVIEVEWHAIRRRIRGEQPVSEEAPRPGWLRPVSWGLAGMAAAAALAVAFFVGPQRPDAGSPPQVADGYVSYVKVFNTSDEAMVYEDQQSGWLVVWVTNDPETSGT